MPTDSFLVLVDISIRQPISLEQHHDIADNQSLEFGWNTNQLFYNVTNEKSSLAEQS